MSKKLQDLTFARRPSQVLAYLSPGPERVLGPTGAGSRTRPAVVAAAAVGG